MQEKKIITVSKAIAALALIISFFLPWVSWGGQEVSGYAMPVGDFFTIAEKKFGLGNPFPQFDFAFKAFWLIPVMALFVLLLVLLKKKTQAAALLTGAFSLSLVLVYYLFSQKLTELGNHTVISNWLFVHALASVMLMIFAGGKKPLLNTAAVLLVAAATYLGFKIVSREAEKKFMGQTHEATESLKEDFSISAENLIREFLRNDSAANKKYNEKTLLVSGPLSTIEIAEDSTSTLSFADSTGSYAAFTIEKNQFEKAKTLKQGDPVSVKGICSGSMYSDILGNTSITFKRSTLISK
jgi:hypothetical protein